MRYVLPASTTTPTSAPSTFVASTLVALTLVADDGRQFKSLVLDEHIISAHKKLVHEFKERFQQLLVPSLARLRSRIYENHPEARLSEDALSRRLTKLELPYDSEQRFRQQVIRALTLNWGHEENIPLTTTALHKRYQELGFPVSRSELKKAWLALRRRETEVLSLHLKREDKPRPVSPVQRFLTEAYDSAASTVAAQQRAPTIEEFLHRLSQAPKQFLPSSVTPSRFRDAVLRRVNRLNHWLPVDKQLVFSTLSKLDLRDSRIVPTLQKHVEKNAGSITIEVLRQEVARETKISLTHHQMRGLVHRSREHLGLTASTRSNHFPERVSNSEIIQAYEVITSLYERMKVPRGPTLAELRRELAERDRHISCPSLRQRTTQICSWQHLHNKPSLRIARGGTSIVAYAIATAYEEIASSSAKPSRREVAEEVSELLNRELRDVHLERFCSPAGRQAHVSDPHLRRRLQKVNFSPTARSGLTERIIATLKSTQKTFAAVFTEIQSTLHKSGVSADPSYLRKRLREADVPFFGTRAAQCRSFCATTVAAWGKTHLRFPTFEDLALASTQQNLNYSRHEIILALRALRKNNREAVGAFHVERRNLGKLIERVVMRDRGSRKNRTTDLVMLVRSSGLAAEKITELAKELNLQRAQRGESLLLISGIKQHDALGLLEKISDLKEQTKTAHPRPDIVSSLEALAVPLQNLVAFEQQEGLTWLAPLPIPLSKIDPVWGSALFELRRLIHTVSVVGRPLELADSDRLLIEKVEQDLEHRFNSPHHPLRGVAQIIIEALAVDIIEVGDLHRILGLCTTPYLNNFVLFRELTDVLRRLPGKRREALPVVA